jgi:hypothetical protein
LRSLSFFFCELEIDLLPQARRRAQSVAAVDVTPGAGLQVQRAIQRQIAAQGRE